MISLLSKKPYIPMDKAKKAQIVEKVELRLYPHIINGPQPQVHSDTCRCLVCWNKALDSLVERSQTKPHTSIDPFDGFRD